MVCAHLFKILHIIPRPWRFVSHKIDGRICMSLNCELIACSCLPVIENSKNDGSARGGRNMKLALHETAKYVENIRLNLVTPHNLVIPVCFKV